MDAGSGMDETCWPAWVRREGGKESLETATEEGGGLGGGWEWVWEGGGGSVGG